MRPLDRNRRGTLLFEFIRIPTGIKNCIDNLRGARTLMAQAARNGEVHTERCRTELV